jgi:hypothetical protein
MGLMSDDDWDFLDEDFAAIRDDDAVEIVIRRGNTVLPAQTVRITGTGGQASRDQSEGAAESRDRVLIKGAIDLDIQPKDRFTHVTQLYTVVSPPDRRAGQTTAEATRT